MEADVSTPAPASPSSWRDVYTLVQDVEQRLTKRMDEIADTAKNAVTDHEVRIRVLEKTDSDAGAARGERKRIGDLTNKGIAALILIGNFTLGFIVFLVNILTSAA